MESPEKHDEMIRLLHENIEATHENNKILKKIYKQNLIGYVIRIVWYGLLIGVPFAVYFYFLEPYFEAFGSNYEVFQKGMAEIPGLKGIEALFP